MIPLGRNIAQPIALSVIISCFY